MRYSDGRTSSTARPADDGADLRFGGYRRARPSRAGRTRHVFRTRTQPEQRRDALAVGSFPTASCGSRRRTPVRFEQCVRRYTCTGIDSVRLGRRTATPRAPSWRRVTRCELPCAAGSARAVYHNVSSHGVRPTLRGARCSSVSVAHFAHPVTNQPPERAAPFISTRSGSLTNRSGGAYRSVRITNAPLGVARRRIGRPARHRVASFYRLSSIGSDFHEYWQLLPSSGHGRRGARITHRSAIIRKLFSRAADGDGTHHRSHLSSSRASRRGDPRRRGVVENAVPASIAPIACGLAVGVARWARVTEPQLPTARDMAAVARRSARLYRVDRVPGGSPRDGFLSTYLVTRRCLAAPRRAVRRPQLAGLVGSMRELSTALARCPAAGLALMDRGLGPHRRPTELVFLRSWSSHLVLDPRTTTRCHVDNNSARGAHGARTYYW